MNDRDRNLMLDSIEYIRYWQGGFFNNACNHSKWDHWYINPNDGYIMFGDYQSKKDIMPEAIKLCDTTQETFETLSNESLLDCFKYMTKQVGLKEPI